MTYLLNPSDHHTFDGNTATETRERPAKNLMSRRYSRRDRRANRAI